MLNGITGIWDFGFQVSYFGPGFLGLRFGLMGITGIWDFG